MNTLQKSNSSSGYPVKSIIRAVLVAALGAALYSAVFSQSKPTSIDNDSQAMVSSAHAAAQTAGGWPAPSSTATEGSVVDLTFPQ